MERGLDSGASAAPGGISPCREYAGAALGERGGLYVYGTVRPAEEYANACADLYYDQDVPEFWLLGSREGDHLGE
jgi:hypothetical protein